VATAIQAVAACREAVDGELVDEGLGLLETFRHDAGGFSAREGGPADASTTANAVQALRAVGNEPGSEWESLIVGLQQESGAVAFRADVAAPLIKTTAEVLLAQRSGLAPS
jgi:squalene cyclase